MTFYYVWDFSIEAISHAGAWHNIQLILCILFFLTKKCSYLIHWKNCSSKHIPPPVTWWEQWGRKERKPVQPMCCCFQDIILPCWKPVCRGEKRAKYSLLPCRRREVTKQIMTLSLTCDRLHSCVCGASDIQEWCVNTGCGWNTSTQRWNGAGALIRPWRVCAIVWPGLVLTLSHMGVCIYLEVSFLWNLFLSWNILCGSWD